MREVRSRAIFQHFFEPDPVLNAELIFLTDFDLEFHARAFVDDEVRASSLLLRWEEPGEDHEAIWVRGIEEKDILTALEHLESDPPKKDFFLLFEHRFRDLAASRYSPSEEGDLKIYSVTREAFKPYDTTPTVQLSLKDAERVFEVTRGKIVRDLAYLKWIMALGTHRGVEVDGQLVAFAGAVWRSRPASEIGVAVREGHRRKGYAKAVVSAVTKDLLDAGTTPFYQTTENNPGSWRTAVALGYELRGTFGYLRVRTP